MTWINWFHIFHPLICMYLGYRLAKRKFFLKGFTEGSKLALDESINILRSYNWESGLSNNVDIDFKISKIIELRNKK